MLSLAKLFSGVHVWALCRPVKVFHNGLCKPYLYGPCFGTNISLECHYEVALKCLHWNYWNDQTH